MYLTTLDNMYLCHTRTGPCRIGLSAVLWVSIPAAASIVAPQRRRRRSTSAIKPYNLGPFKEQWCDDAVHLVCMV